MKKCTLCPRECNVDRNKQKGFCQCDDTIHVAKTMLHHWEEPCISGQNGSGAIFFSGCTLKCVYCQNRDISRNQSGKAYTEKELAELFVELQNMGAHNINLV
ncbi:MAG: 4Fe-4S cluster-binding domain-containing protein, partial [Clostridia bacterium]|nr:4Fe-4S cluster-binding domain-containing protein [Clostridia bacterium]